MNTFAQDPDARLDYTIDWTDFLTANTDTAASIELITPEGITTDGSTLVEGSKHTFFISGGTAGRVYRITSRITTTDGRINDQSIIILIREH